MNHNWNIIHEKHVFIYVLGDWEEKTIKIDGYVKWLPTMYVCSWTLTITRRGIHVDLKVSKIFFEDEFVPRVMVVITALQQFFVEQFGILSPQWIVVMVSISELLSCYINHESDLSANWILSSTWSGQAWRFRKDLWLKLYQMLNIKSCCERFCLLSTLLMLTSLHII